MKLQQYLNNLENKQELKEINLTKIQQERGESELLEGGELDLREFTSLEKVEIDSKLLKTPLTKLNVDGLTHLKELDWLESKEDTSQEKQLWTELGIEGNNEKKEVVREVNKLVKLWNEETSESLQPIKVNFTQKDITNGEINSAEQKDITVITLLDKNDKNGNFCPSLVFWNFAQELTNISIGGGEKSKTPEFWKQFEEQRIWVKENLIENYQKEFSDLLTPSTFPTEKLEINQILVVNDLEGKEENVNKDFSVNSPIVDKAWQIIKDKALELGIRAIIHYQNDNTYTIMINYAPDNPSSKELEELMINTPLKLENELLKEEKEQLPTSENFAKLTKKAQVLENYLQDLMSEEEYEKIKAEIDKIN